MNFILLRTWAKGNIRIRDFRVKYSAEESRVIMKYYCCFISTSKEYSTWNPSLLFRVTTGYGGDFFLEHVVNVSYICSQHGFHTTGVALNKKSTVSLVSDSGTTYLGTLGYLCCTRKVLRFNGSWAVHKPSPTLVSFKLH